MSRWKPKTSKNKDWTISALQIEPKWWSEVLANQILLYDRPHCSDWLMFLSTILVQFTCTMIGQSFFLDVFGWKLSRHDYNRTMNFRKLSKSEYSAHWKCIQAAGMYVMVQFAKMLILATFFTETDSPSGIGDIVSELFKCSVDFTDLLGLYILMGRLTVKGPIKFTAAAVGWASAEFIVTRAIPFWVGARGTEFDWTYIRMGFETNALLLQHIATASLVWLYMRRDLADTYRYLVVALMITCVYRPLLIQLITYSLALGPWMKLLLQMVYSVAMALFTIPLYGKVATVSY